MLADFLTAHIVLINLLKHASSAASRMGQKKMKAVFVASIILASVILGFAVGRMGSASANTIHVERNSV